MTFVKYFTKRKYKVHFKAEPLHNVQKSKVSLSLLSKFQFLTQLIGKISLRWWSCWTFTPPEPNFFIQYSYQVKAKKLLLFFFHNVRSR